MSSDLPHTPPNTRIPARSQRQAMDWSLVLASQGIEHGLEHAEETGWALTVTEADYSSALTAILQYRLENRRWPWQKAIPKTTEVFDWLAAAWVLLTLVFYWLSNQHATIEVAGILDGAAVANGQWWRLFTATLLHANLAHLLANAGFGFLLLGLALGRYGAGAGLLAAFLAGVAGNVVTWLVHGKEFHGLGASGVVMGALGLIAAPAIAQARNNPTAFRFTLAALAAGLMLFVLLGLSSDSDVVAHAGGFAAGIVIALPLTAVSRGVASSVVNIASGLVFALFILLTWWLALRHVT